MRKILRDIFQSDIFAVILISIITVLIFRPLIFKTGYPSWSDNAGPLVMNMDRYDDIANFTYSEKHNGLVYNSNIILTDFLVNKFAHVLDYFICSQKDLVVAWVIFPYIVMNISMYFALKNILKNNSVSLNLTIFYIFSIVGLTNLASGWVTTTYSQAAGILFLSFFIRYLREPNFKSILIMSILSIFGFMNISNMYGIIIVCFAVFIVWLFINFKDVKKSFYLFRGILLLPVLMFLINMFWLLPLPFMSRQMGTSFNLKNIYTSSTYTFINTFSFASSFSLFEPAQEIFGFYNSLLYKILFFAFILVIFSKVFFKIRDDKFVMNIFILYILVFSLSMGEKIKPVWFFLQMLPTSFLIRSPQLKFHTTCFFLLLLLVGYLILKYRCKKILFSLLFLIFIGFVYSSRGKIFTYWDSIVIPEDYIQAVQYLSKEENRYKTLMKFPPTSGGPQLSWREDIYTYPIIDVMLYNPLVVRTWGDSMVPVYLRNLYTHEAKNISNILGDSGVKFILVHKDYTNFPVKRDFSNEIGFKLIVGGKNIDLYELSDDYYKPLFFNSDINLDFERINPVKHVVYAQPGNKITFNRSHDVSLNLYDDKDLNNIGYYKCNIKFGNMNFCDLMLLSVSPISKNTLENNHRNSWITPKDSSGKYVVYYEPQIYFYIGLIISSLTLFFLVFYLIILINGEKNKRLVLK